MSKNPNDEFLPFSRPSISQAAIDEVVACLKSGWITTGPRVKQFEEDLKTYLGAPHVLALTSATAGLHLVLTALNMRQTRARRCRARHLQHGRNEDRESRYEAHPRHHARALCRAAR